MEVITIKKNGSDIYLCGEPIYIDDSIHIDGIGQLELRETPKAGLHLVVFKDDLFKYSLPLIRDGEYKIGKDFGHRIKGEEDKKKILKNLLRKLNIPINVLKFNLEQYRTKMKQLTDLIKVGDYNEFVITDGDIKVEPNGSSQIITIKADSYSYIIKSMKILSREKYVKTFITEINISDEISKYNLEKAIYETLRN